MAKQSEQTTHTQDVTYNLVSVLYHALEGADTYRKYLQDAEQSGNNELAQFFREAIDQNRKLADRAKALLGSKLGSAVSGGVTQGSEQVVSPH